MPCLGYFLKILKYYAEVLFAIDKRWSTYIPFVRVPPIGEMQVPGTTLEDPTTMHYLIVLKMIW